MPESAGDGSHCRDEFPLAVDEGKHPSRSQRRQLTLLLVDRDSSVAKRLSSAFPQLGVEQAASIAEALPLIRGRLPLDLALIDFELLDGCAFPLLRALAQHRPAVPRVLMSNTTDVRRLRGSDLAHLFLVKPFQLSVVERILRARVAHDWLEH